MEDERKMKEVTIPSYRWDEEESEDNQDPQVTLAQIREIFSDEPEETMVYESNIEDEMLELKLKLNELERIVEQISLPKKRITKAEQVYEKLRSKLEKKSMGKIVAIDVNKADVVAIDDTIEEAYAKAITKSDKKRFYFRKVGQSQLSSI